MASNFVSEDFETSDEVPKDNGFILEVYETNYHFEKRFAEKREDGEGRRGVRERERRGEIGKGEGVDLTV